MRVFFLFAALLLILLFSYSCYSPVTQNVLIVCDIGPSDVPSGCHEHDIIDMFRNWITGSLPNGSIFRVAPVGSDHRPILEYKFRGFSGGQLSAQQAAVTRKISQQINEAFSKHRKQLSESGSKWKPLLDTINQQLKGTSDGNNWHMVIISDFIENGKFWNFSKAVPKDISACINKFSGYFKEGVRYDHNVELSTCGYFAEEFDGKKMDIPKKTSIAVICDNSKSGDKRCNKKILRKFFNSWIERTPGLPKSKFSIFAFPESNKALALKPYFTLEVEEKSSPDGSDIKDEKKSLSKIGEPKRRTNKSPLAETIWHATRYLAGDKEKGYKTMLIVVSDLRQESESRDYNCPKVNFSDSHLKKEHFLNWSRDCGYLSTDLKGKVDNLYVCGVHALPSTSSDTVSASEITSIESCWHSFFNYLEVPQIPRFSEQCDPDMAPWPFPRPTEISPDEWNQIESIWQSIFEKWGFTSVRLKRDCNIKIN